MISSFSYHNFHDYRIVVSFELSKKSLADLPFRGYSLSIIDDSKFEFISWTHDLPNKVLKGEFTSSGKVTIGVTDNVEEMLPENLVKEVVKLVNRYPTMNIPLFYNHFVVELASYLEGF